MRIKKENSELVALIKKLHNERQPIWKKVAAELAKSRRNRIEVNLSKLDKFANDGMTIVVPGKVLGAGMLTKKVRIAAFNFSESAKKLINDSGSQMLTIEEILKENPRGSGILILK